MRARACVSVRERAGACVSGCSRATRQCSHVTQGWTANALAGDVVQPEDSVQPERKTLQAEYIALDDASMDGKRF